MYLCFLSLARKKNKKVKPILFLNDELDKQYILTF